MNTLAFSVFLLNLTVASVSVAPVQGSALARAWTVLAYAIMAAALPAIGWVILAFATHQRYIRRLGGGRDGHEPGGPARDAPGSIPPPRSASGDRPNPGESPV